MRKNIFLLIISIIAAQTAYGGLPPTQTKADGESAFSTTFQVDYDTQPVTRTGTKIKLGTLPLTMGGTGSTTQNFVDLTTNQTIAGDKNFTAPVITDDVEFNDPAYNTITLKRALGHQVSTGVVDGAVLSINADPTKFNLSQQILSFSDAVTSSDTPDIKFVTCPALTAQTVTNLAIADTSYLLVANDCSVTQQTTFPTQIQRRDKAFIGRLAHINHVNLSTAATLPDFVVDTNSQLYDLFDAVGAFNVSGNVISANGVNLQFNKSAGVTFRRSVGYPTNKKNPNTVAIAGQVPVSFVRLTQTTLTPGPFTAIDPAIYDVAGTQTAIPNPGSTSTNKRVYLFSNGQIAVQQGQTLYSGLADALAGVSNETFVVNPTAVDGGILLGIITCRKDATDLSNPAQCHITKAGRFDNSGITVGSLATTTLQQAYLNSVQPQIITSATQGSVDIRRGSAADTDNILRIQNGAGTAVKTFTGVGENEGVTTDAATTGANATVASPASPIVRLTNASLTSIDMIAGPVDGRVITIVNATGALVAINNNTGATAANRILTGTGLARNLRDEETIILKYDGTEARWMLTGMGGLTAKGQSDSSFSGVNQLQVPNKQLTTVGTGSRLLETGSDNIMPDPGVEGTTQPWVAYNDGSVAAPITGTGAASANFTCAPTTSSPLDGTASLLATKTAASSQQGKGCSTPITISASGAYKIHTVRFDYAATHANYVDDYLKVYMIGPAGEVIEVLAGDNGIKANANGGTFLGTFQATTAGAYRAALHVYDSGSALWDFKADNIEVSRKQKSVKGAVVTDWVSFTPTGGWTTNTTYTGRYRRVGDMLQVEGGVALGVGGPNSATLSINLPAGLTIDLTKISRGSSARDHVGQVHVFDTGVQSYAGAVQLAGVNSYVVLSYFPIAAATTNTGAITQAVPFAFGASDTLDFKFEVPISGWSSNLTLSEDGGQRVVRFRGAGNGGTASTVNVTNIPFTLVEDTTGSWDAGTSSYVVPETGSYDIVGSINYTANATYRAALYSDPAGGTSYTLKQTLGNLAIAASESSASFSGGSYLTKGTRIAIRDTGSSGTLSSSLPYHWIQITKDSTPQTLAGSETVAVRAVSSTGQSIPNNTITTVTWNTAKTIDTHNSLNTSTGEYTIPASGNYSISAALSFTASAWTQSTNATATVIIYKNGVLFSATEVPSQATASYSMNPEVSDIVPCVKGDIITIRALHVRGSATTLLNSSAFNFFSATLVK